MSLKWVAVGLLAASGCVMSGYDRASVPPVSPPGAGRAGSDAPAGAAGSDGMRSGNGGASSGSGGSAARAGSAAPVSCGALPAGSACDDGIACTENDVCAGGFCQGKRKACPFTLNDCSPVECIEELGECSNAPVADLTICGFGQVNQCVAGLCTVAEVCDEEPCTVECDGLSCLYECPGATLCQPVCERSACYFDCKGAVLCDASCELNTRCTVDCRDAAECKARCDANARCVVDCRGADRCEDIVCAPGSQCAIQCSPGMTCKFASCDSGQVTCGADRIGCGGCPE